MMNSLVPENWHVLKTNFFTELKVYSSLIIKERSVFIPFGQNIRNRNNRKKKIHRPLISSIIFIIWTLKDLEQRMVNLE